MRGTVFSDFASPTHHFEMQERWRWVDICTLPTAAEKPSLRGSSSIHLLPYQLFRLPSDHTPKQRILNPSPYPFV